jgi:hypothetical protein
LSCRFELPLLSTPLPLRQIVWCHIDPEQAGLAADLLERVIANLEPP